MAEENNYVKRVSELEVEIMKLQNRAGNVEIALSTSQEAYREIASALDKLEQEYEENVKIAVDFKPIIEKMLKESVKMTANECLSFHKWKANSFRLLPFITQISTAPQPLIPREVVGDANKGEKEVLKRRQEVTSTSDEGKAKKWKLKLIIVKDVAPQSDTSLQESVGPYQPEAKRRSKRSKKDDE